MIVEPEPGNVIVELPSSEWGDVPITEKTHSSVSYGKIVAMHSEDAKEKAYLLGRIGHWHLYREDVRIPGTDKAVVELKDIMATSREDNK